MPDYCHSPLNASVNQPVIKAAQLVKDIGSKLNGLENLGLDFYRKLAGTTIFISTKLAKQFFSVLNSCFGCFCNVATNGF
jgi:hypothetical protein